MLLLYNYLLMKLGTITISAAVAVLCFGSSTMARRHTRHHSLVSLDNQYDGIKKDLADIAAHKDIY
jgi:hypothetical protein